MQINEAEATTKMTLAIMMVISSNLYYENNFGCKIWLNLGKILGKFAGAYCIFGKVDL